MRSTLVAIITTQDEAQYAIISVLHIDGSLSVSLGYGSSS